MRRLLLTLFAATLSLDVPALHAAEGQAPVATVSNPSAYVKADGTFRVRGIPAFAAWERNDDGTNTFRPGQPIRYRVRVTTAQGDSGASVERFVIPFQFSGDPAVVNAPPIEFGTALGDIPARITGAAQATELTYGQTTQMTVVATAGNGATTDITADPAIIYTSSNPLVARVSPAGAITARKRGAPSTAVITALYDGLATNVTVRVANVFVDSDGDGIEDEWETLYGFNPHNPGDAGLDPDGDGLTNLQEYERGTNPLHPDTDRDGIDDATDDDPLVPESVPPSIAIAEPIPWQSFRGNDTVSLRATATDNARVVRTQFFVNGVDMGTSDGDAVSFDFRMGDYSSGQPVLIEVRAWDVVGNEGVQSVEANPEPNSIQINQPYYGQEFAAGDTVTISASATGFYPVTSLRCVVNGVELAAVNDSYLDLSQTASDLFAGASEVTVEFYATNENGDEYGDSVNIRLKNTFVNAARTSGRIVADGQPVPGAWIKATDGSVVRSGADGRFAIVRAVRSNLPLNLLAWAEINGRVQANEVLGYDANDNGAGEVWTDVGDIDLTPGPLLAGQMGDLTAEGQAVDLPTPVTFYGTQYGRVVVRAGLVAFGADSPAANDDAWRAGPPVAVVLGGPGAISAGASSVPGSGPLGQYVRADQSGVTVTWLGIRRLSNGNTNPVSAQISIATNGEIRTVYGTQAYGYQGTVVGLYPGGGLGDPRNYDFSNWAASSGDSGGANPIRQAGSNFIQAYNLVATFTPTAQNGYAVTTSRPVATVTDPSLSGRLLFGDQPLANATVRLSTGQSAVTDAGGRFSFTPLGAQPPIYVAGDAAPGGTGASWETAYQSLDDALSVAGYGREVWVKAGTYDLAQGRGLYGVAVFGGFAGSEASRSQRDWRANPARIRSGHLYLYPYAHLDGLVFDSAGSDQWSPYVTVASYGWGGAEPSANIRNCVFTNHPAYWSAAVEVQDRTHAVFERCVFADNHGAAALANWGTAILSNSLFTGNEAQYWGAPVYSGSGSALALSHCTVARNLSEWWQPCVSAEGRLIVQNSVISNELGNGVSDALGQGEVYDSLVSNWYGDYYGDVTPWSVPAFANHDQPRGPDGAWGTADDGLALQHEHAVPDPDNPNGPDGIPGTADDHTSIVPSSVGLDALSEFNQVVDLAGRARPAGVGGDIGAYESQGVSLVVPDGPRPFQSVQRLWDMANLTMTITDPAGIETYTIPNIGVLPNRSSDTGDVTVGQPAPNGIGLRIPTSDPARMLTVVIAARRQP